MSGRFPLLIIFAARLERWDYSLGDELGLDEFLYFGRLDGFHEGFGLVAVFVGFAHYDDVRVGRILVFDYDRVFSGVEAGFASEVRVDDGGGHVLERARKLGGVDLAYLKLLRVVGDVLRGDELAFLDLDEPCFLKDAERAGAVGRVVRYRYLRAVFDFIDALYLRRVEAHRFDVDLRDPDALESALFVRVVEVRDVLEEVRVDGAFRKRGVRRHVVGELDYLELVALFFKQRTRRLHDVLVREGRYAYADFLLVRREGRRGDQKGRCQYCCKKFLHSRSSPFLFIFYPPLHAEGRTPLLPDFLVNVVAYALYDLDDHYQYRDGVYHYVRLEAVVAVFYREVAEAAAADYARHRRVAEQVYRDYGPVEDERGHRLFYHYAPDYLPRGGSE